MTLPLIKRWFSGLMIVGWGILLIYFYQSGRLEYYLAPKFHGIVLAAAVLAGLLAILYLVLGRSWICADPDCAGCASHVEDTRFRGWFPLLATLLMMTGSLAITQDAFSLQTVFKTGFLDSPDLLPMRPDDIERETGKWDNEPLDPIDEAVFGEPFEAKFYLPRTEDGAIRAELVDLIFAVEDDIMLRDFENEDVEVIGQFVPLPDVDPRDPTYKISRFVMWCCAADARPLAVRVSTEAIPELPEMGWVKVKGKATFPVRNGQRTVVIEETSIEPTEKPEGSALY